MMPGSNHCWRHQTYEEDERSECKPDRAQPSTDERSECKPGAKRKRDSAQPEDMAQPSTSDHDHIDSWPVDRLPGRWPQLQQTYNPTTRCFSRRGGSNSTNRLCFISRSEMVR